MFSKQLVELAPLINSVVFDRECCRKELIGEQMFFEICENYQKYFIKMVDTLP